MTDINRDLFISMMIIIGVWSFISGQFIISALTFGSAAMFSNIVMRAKFNR